MWLQQKRCWVFISHFIWACPVNTKAVVQMTNAPSTDVDAEMEGSAAIKRPLVQHAD